MKTIPASGAALVLALTIATGLPTGSVRAQDQPIYGSQLMTEPERSEYRARLRTATSEEERQQIRLEHHAEMQERARERGVELPDEPPAMGMGGQRMGPRQDGGGGMGSGGGMGGAKRGGRSG